MAETSKKLEDNAEPNPSDTRDRGRLHAVADQALGAARVQRWQQTYLDTVRHSLATVGGKHRDLIQSNSPVKLAEVQRDLYVDLVNATVRSTTNLLQLAGQIVQESVRLLQERAQARG